MNLKTCLGKRRKKNQNGCGLQRENTLQFALKHLLFLRRRLRLGRNKCEITEKLT